MVAEWAPKAAAFPYHAVGHGQPLRRSCRTWASVAFRRHFDKRGGKLVCLEHYMKCTVRRFTGASGIHNGGVMYTTVQWRAVRATVVHYAESVYMCALQ